MDLEDIVTLVHFRELHFLPRVIFSVGGILLIGSFFVKLFLLCFLGVGLIFAGSALNLVINTLQTFDRHFSDKTVVGVPWALLWQAVLALVLTFATLCLVYYFYRHGEMPPCLQPLKKS
jgi:hypothetical protein